MSNPMVIHSSFGSFYLDILFRARQSLIDVYRAVRSAALSPPQITFNGLSHFNNKVLYMNPVQDHQLNQLARIAG